MEALIPPMLAEFIWEDCLNRGDFEQWTNFVFVGAIQPSTIQLQQCTEVIWEKCVKSGDFKQWTYLIALGIVNVQPSTLQQRHATEERTARQLSNKPRQSVVALKTPYSSQSVMKKNLEAELQFSEARSEVKIRDDGCIHALKGEASENVISGAEASIKEDGVSNDKDIDVKEWKRNLADIYVEESKEVDNLSPKRKKVKSNV